MKKNQVLKKEYDRVFTAHNQSREADRQREERAIKGIYLTVKQCLLTWTAINPHEAVKEIPAHVDVYKQKLREKEREVNELADRVC